MTAPDAQPELVTAEQARELDLAPIKAREARTRKPWTGGPDERYWAEKGRRDLLTEVGRLHARMEAAEARERRVRALHRPRDFHHPGGVSTLCSGCGVLYVECRTRAALDGEGNQPARGFADPDTSHWPRSDGHPHPIYGEGNQ